MAIALHTPRINNNDDTVRLTGVLAAIGAQVRRGEAVAEIETDKAVFTVESEHDGYLLRVLATPGDTIDVGSILAWIGSSPEEAVPAEAPRGDTAQSKRDASLKAVFLLSRFGLDAANVPCAGQRLEAADVERYIEANGLRERTASNSGPHKAPALPPSAGRMIDPTPNERGMLRTVAWHKHEAVPGYVEIGYAPDAWQRYAEEFQKSNQLLMSPLLALLAWRLTQLAKDHPQINSTMVGEKKYAYDHVSLGFTVQAGERLYIVAVPEAEALSEAEFVERLGRVQRAAMKGSLSPKDSSGATIGFSSMARWAVTRHMPVLSPHTAMIVAHTAPLNGTATLGATYDHRVLSGFEVVRVLQSLSRPPEPL